MSPTPPSADQVQAPGDSSVLRMSVSPSRADDAIIILSNAPDLLLAKRIAHMLVEEHLAACVNLGAAGLSMYMWQGKLEGAEEIPIVIKTTAGRAPALVERLLQLHPYEVPEVLVLPVMGGTAGYLDWMRAQTATAGQQGDT